MTRSLLYLFALFLLVFESCDHATDPLMLLGHHRLRAIQPPSIIGTWNWIESVGVYYVATPTTEGYTIRLRFDKDSNYYFYRNDTLLLQDNYEMLRAPAPGWTSDTTSILIIGDVPGRSQTEFVAEFIETDTLKLTLLALDGGYAKYSRLRENVRIPRGARRRE